MNNLLMQLAKLSAQGGLPQLPRPAPSELIPYAPVPDLGPLSTDTALAFAARNPEPVPPAFVQPAPPDMGFVNQYAGPEPTAPPPARRPGKLEIIATILQGIGAGYEGRGAEYAEGIRQRREAPQRRYEQAQREFEDRRARGLELAERRAEREAEAISRAAAQAYERDFKVWLQANGDRGDEAKERMRQAFTLERDARQARLEEEKEQRRVQRAREDDARGIAGRLGTGPGAASPAIAKELGRYYANLTNELSPQAANWMNAQARRMNALAGRSAGGGTGGRASNAALQAAGEVEAAKGELIAFMQNMGRFTVAERAAEERRIRSRIGRAVGNLRKYPGQVQGGLDNQGWPWSQIWDGRQFVNIVPEQPQAMYPGASAEFSNLSPGIGALTPTVQGSSEADVQEYARLYGVKPEVARRELQEMRRK